MRRLGWMLALTLVGGGGGAALADPQAADRPVERRDKPAVASPMDQTFVDKAATGGLAEVKLSKLAMEKGQSMQVKQFARKMVVDHSKANTELKQIAEKQHLTVPTQLDEKHQKAYDKLSKLDGPAFDEEYMKVMAEDHDETIKLFKQQAASGRDPELTSFAMKTLPVIEKHDDMAHSDEKKLEESKAK
jgi:putative membrane protein